VVRKYQVEALAAFCTLLIVCICVSADRAGSTGVPRKAAVFAFELEDTSHEGELRGKRADETMRLAALDQLMLAKLKSSGRFEVVDLSGVAAKVESSTPLRKCNGCAGDIAKEVGAEVAIVGWVQKVSNLILNVNVEIEEAATGKILDRASADIRGNTDESWKRGLDYLLRNRILKASGGG
jgi:hypothetical protein